MTPLLSATDLRLTVGGREIVQVDEFHLARGEVLALVGPNGAGKTSLLLSLALLQPASGTIVFDGQIAGNGNRLQFRRRMAVVFQESLLLDTTVEGNVTTALRVRGVPRKEARARAAQWLERFGVAHLANQSARSLSGGEAQRTNLARAFALEPELLFLDEPFAALDYPTRKALLLELKQVLRDMKATTLFVTHDYAEIPHLASRVAVMLGGKILKTGDFAAVFGEDALERRLFAPWEA